jgi:hypothetical protein
LKVPRNIVALFDWNISFETAPSKNLNSFHKFLKIMKSLLKSSFLIIGFNFRKNQEVSVLEKPTPINGVDYYRIDTP